MEKSIIILGLQGSGKFYLLLKLMAAYGRSKVADSDVNHVEEMLSNNTTNDFDVYAFYQSNHKVLDYIVNVAKNHNLKFIVCSQCEKHELPEYIQQNFEIIDIRFFLNQPQ